MKTTTGPDKLKHALVLSDRAIIGRPRNPIVWNVRVFIVDFNQPSPIMVRLCALPSARTTVQKY